MTDEDKEAHVRNFEEMEGVKLDVSQISKNPGKRSLAKLMLNSYVLPVYYTFEINDYRKIKIYFFFGKQKKKFKKKK